MCEFNDAGYPISNISGGFRQDFHITVGSNGMPHPVAEPYQSNAYKYCFV